MVDSTLLIVGLTGGIASGKSTVSEMFLRVGAKVIDADRIARQVVSPGLPAWQDIKDLFGDEVLLADGELDRVVLGEKVFKNSVLRGELEAIVHPHVRRQMREALMRLEQAAHKGVVILDVPLLLETGMDEGLAEVIVVYLPPHLQIQRLMQRDGLGRQQSQIRIDAQMPMDEKRKLATIVIDNSGDLKYTQDQVTAVYRTLNQRVTLRPSE